MNHTEMSSSFYVNQWATLYTLIAYISKNVLQNEEHSLNCLSTNSILLPNLNKSFLTKQDTNWAKKMHNSQEEPSWLVQQHIPEQTFIKTLHSLNKYLFLKLKSKLKTNHKFVVNYSKLENIYHACYIWFTSIFVM